MARRIRTIKPELLEDEFVAALSSNAFRLFVSCLLLADDFGNLRWSSGLLAGSVFWKLMEAGSVTMPDVKAAMGELVAERPMGKQPLVVTYVIRGQTYAHLTGWERHQKISKPGLHGACPKPYEPSLQDSRDPRESPGPPATDPDPDLDLDHDLDQEIPPTPQGGSGAGGGEGSGGDPEFKTSSALPTAGVDSAGADLGEARRPAAKREVRGRTASPKAARRAEPTRGELHVAAYEDAVKRAYPNHPFGGIKLTKGFWDATKRHALDHEGNPLVGEALTDWIGQKVFEWASSVNPQFSPGMTPYHFVRWLDTPKSARTQRRQVQEQPAEGALYEHPEW